MNYLNDSYQQDNSHLNNANTNGSPFNSVLSKRFLRNTWTLWYCEPDNSKLWEDTLNHVTSFNTEADFWSLYGHIKTPSTIQTTSDLALFKKGIMPMWEDPSNRQGGRWIIKPSASVLKSDFDQLWLHVLLCLILENFENSAEVCGAVVNIRGKNSKISVWTANGSNDTAVLEIGNRLKTALHLEEICLYYQLHNCAMVGSPFNKSSIYKM